MQEDETFLLKRDYLFSSDIKKYQLLTKHKHVLGTNEIEVCVQAGIHAGGMHTDGFPVYLWGGGPCASGAAWPVMTTLWSGWSPPIQPAVDRLVLAGEDPQNGTKKIKTMVFDIFTPALV